MRSKPQRAQQVVADARRLNELVPHVDADDAEHARQLRRCRNRHLNVREHGTEEGTGQQREQGDFDVDHVPRFARLTKRLPDDRGLKSEAGSNRFVSE